MPLRFLQELTDQEQWDEHHQSLHRINNKLDAMTSIPATTPPMAM